MQCQCAKPVLYSLTVVSLMLACAALTVISKSGIEGLAGLANAVPLSEAVCNAGPLFD